MHFLQNLSLKSAHATPTLSTPRSYTSPSFQANRSFASTSQSSTPNTNEFRCHLCDFSTTRLNVIVLHNKTHAADAVAKPIVESPRASGKMPPNSLFFDRYSLLLTLFLASIIIGAEILAAHEFY